MTNLQLMLAIQEAQANGFRAIAEVLIDMLRRQLAEERQFPHETNES